jgi:thiamine biosynthesis lipoprotein
MGMPVRVVLHAGSEMGARDAATAAFARIAALEQIFSDYRQDSEVSRLGARPREWVPVSAELFRVMETAIDVARATEGAFDPTVGPLVALWREARRTKRLPAPDVLAAARSRTGWRLVTLDREARAIRLDAAGMRLDPGGIAKGYILQEALATLAASSAPRAMVEAGGDIAAGDAPPGRDGWRIAAPGAGAAFAARAARLTRASLATSGPTSQFVEIDGIRYSHVVDPRTGLGLTHDLVARVIAPDGAVADALATALTVLGRDGVAALAARYPGVLVSVTAR